MSLERQQPVVDAGPPGLGFQAAFSFYLGLVGGGVVAVAGLLADVTTPTLLGTLPTTVTAVTIVGHVLAKRARGLPERIGRRRRWRLACYGPAAGFGTAAVAPRVTALESTGRYLAVTIGFALVLGVTAFGLEQLCRNRYVEAVTANEPIATWTYRPAGFLADGSGALAFATMFLLFGTVASIWTGSARPGLFWAAVGLVFVLSSGVGFGDDAQGRTKRYGFGFEPDFSPDNRWNSLELRAHEAGIRLDRGRSRTLVPWDRVTGVELTDDELVLERRFRSIRCERSAIEDPEAVLEAVETLRSRS